MKIGNLALILILAATASASFAADQIHWTVTGQKSVAFDWHSTSATDSKIRYGTSSGDYDNEVTAIHPTPLPSSTGLFWEAKITGLDEDTLYYYAIGTGPEHTFQTPPARGGSDFVVHAESDMGATDNTRSIQTLIAADLPRFVLIPGDLHQADESGGLTVVDRHFNYVTAWSQDAAYMPIWGNHDWDISTAKLTQLNDCEGRFNFPNSQTSPGASAAIGNGPGEDWYWFDYGNVRFIAYPQPYSSATWPDWNTKAKTLMDTAQADGNINFIVTFGHIPAYSSGNHAGNSKLKGMLDSLGDGHSKYVLNINGHSHDYERSFPQHGVVHLTVATGGKSLETVGTCLWRICEQPAWSDFRAMHHGFTQLHFTKTGIQGSFICGPAQSGKNDITCNPGDVVDTFAIGKPIADNLAHHWKFDETSGTTAFDSAGTNNAALSNSSWVAGKIGNAASFNGTNTSGSAGKIDFGRSNFTVAHWVKVNGFKDFAGIFNNRSSASGNVGFHTRTDGSSTIKALIDFGATSKNLAITNAAAGTWYHIAVSVDRAGLMKLYVNGVLAGQTDISAFSAVSITNTDSVRLGRDQVSNYFNGVIDDLRIYDSVLSAAEIFDLFKQ